MKKLFWIALLVALLSPSQAAAQSPFDGTWKMDLNTTQLPTKPGAYLLQAGVYHCRTCIPPIDVRADGLDHRVSGDSCYDTVSIRVLDDRTVQETDKSRGKIVHTEKMTVAADGNTAVWEFSDSCEADFGARVERPAWIAPNFWLVASDENREFIREWTNGDFETGRRQL